MLPRYEQLLRAEEILAVNLHRERFAAGLEPSYIAEPVSADVPAAYAEAVAAPSELSASVQVGERVSAAGSFIGTSFGLVRRVLG